MSATEIKAQRGQPPPPTHPQRREGFNHPRRVSPENSITLKHHRVARNASLRASAGSVKAHQASHSSSPRQNSSGESYQTSKSDPTKWFDHLNEHPTAAYDNGTMDVDPPFFQKETESSEDKSYCRRAPMIPHGQTVQSSSADDYRSVIDDLTVEIKRLKEELKKYRPQGPDLLRKDKLFEIKVHSLPKRKKRELEMTLRDFASTLGRSPNASSSQVKKPIHLEQERGFGGSGPVSKHASSSTGSHAVPVDSAYASMSTGAHSSGTSLGRPSMSTRAGQSQQKVENFLRDIPEGLFPRPTVLTDREKKKLVVRRLEHLFTGKFNGRFGRRNTNMSTAPSSGGFPALTTSGDGIAYALPQNHRQESFQPPHLPSDINAASATEPNREAKIQSPHRRSGKQSRSKEDGSASQSQGEHTESAGQGQHSGFGTNNSPPGQPPPEQRPTRVKDLDPDRVQNPSENMEYIRHLGLVPPELLQHADSEREVHPDADGWVYLNLLYGMAQLHILNVTPDFVRAAVLEVSTKLQLSTDQARIRWRGGTEGTKFSSDASEASPQDRTDQDELDSSEEVRKRQKLGTYVDNDYQSGSSSKNQSKFGPQISGSSEGFHYKPLFVHQESSQEQTSLNDTLSSFGPVDEGRAVESGWGLSASGNSGRKKRKHDGAIIYYHGAPFCTDLSGDAGDVSPAAHMMSAAVAKSGLDDDFVRPNLQRSQSGSLLQHRPLSDVRDARHHLKSSSTDVRSESVADSLAGSDDEFNDTEFTWSKKHQYMAMQSLEPCGLGGVFPNDHFMVVVTTRRSKDEASQPPANTKNDETTDGITGRLATMSTLSPKSTAPRSGSISEARQCVDIEYVSGRIKRLVPAPLPPPALFYPPFTPSSSDNGSEESDMVLDSSESPREENMREPQNLNRHHSDDYPDNVDLSSGDEDGEEPDDEYENHGLNGKSASYAIVRPGPQALHSSGSLQAILGTNGAKSASAGPELGATGSSITTAGGVASACSSTFQDRDMDDDDDDDDDDEEE